MTRRFDGNKAQRRRYEDGWEAFGWALVTAQAITRASWWLTFRCDG